MAVSESVSISKKWLRMIRSLFISLVAVGIAGCDPAVSTIRTDDAQELRLFVRNCNKIPNSSHRISEQQGGGWVAKCHVHSTGG